MREGHRSMNRDGEASENRRRLLLLAEQFLPMLSDVMRGHVGIELLPRCRRLTRNRLCVD